MEYPIRVKRALLCLVVCFLPRPALASAQDGAETEKALRVVPLLTSSPLLGLGAGAAVSYLYETGDDNSSKSQLEIGGQYSNTESYVLFANNKAFFRDNGIRSNTLGSFASINNEFTSDGEEVSYNINTPIISQLLMFRVAEGSYVGGLVSYKSFKYRSNNSAGADFLLSNGIVEERTGGIGVAYSYDTRSNKYYPSDATLINVGLNANPTGLGAVRSYYQTIINMRYYSRGVDEGDVWAWQLYGQFSSKNTADNGLPTLSGKSLLRGFPAGQYKALYMTGAQSEYRYQITDTKYRLTSFFGVANLAGGSLGVDGRSRSDDGWYAAGGVGVRYAIQQQTGVDLRLDLVLTSKGDRALYLKLNQAF